jgi:hypothetical protein
MTRSYSSHTTSARDLSVRKARTRWLALGGLAGTALFIPIAFVIGETRDGYSHAAQGISALSEAGAPQAWAQSANFILVGLLVTGLAIGLHQGLGEGRGSALGPVLIAAFGLGALVLNGIFPADPVGAAETRVGTIHSRAAGLGFVAVIASMFVLPRRLVDHRQWKGLASLSRWFGVASILFVVTYLMAQEGAIPAWHPWTGLLQRAMGATVMLWLFLLALRLHQTHA